MADSIRDLAAEAAEKIAGIANSRLDPEDFFGHLLKKAQIKAWSELIHATMTESEKPLVEALCTIYERNVTRNCPSFFCNVCRWHDADDEHTPTCWVGEIRALLKSRGIEC